MLRRLTMIMKSDTMTYLSSDKACPSCGDNHKGKPFCTYENGVHCFSCGYTIKYDRSFAARENRPVEIPEIPDACFNPSKFSVNNLIWLNKYFITINDIYKYNIAESSDGALIFSNMENQQVTHYQLRYNTVPRVIRSHGKKIPSISSVGALTIVLVEDYISHIRVGRSFDTACLWGTKISYDWLETILHYENIVIWLDNDKDKEINSGQEAAKKICKMLNRVIQLKQGKFGFGGIRVPKVHIKITDNDPKCYSDSEIEEILGEFYAAKIK